MENQLPVVYHCWVLTDKPLDFPNDSIIRGCHTHIDGTICHANWAFAFGNALSAGEFMLGMGYSSIGRHPCDDPVIVEVWVWSDGSEPGPIDPATGDVQGKPVLTDIARLV